MLLYAQKWLGRESPACFGHMRNPNLSIMKGMIRDDVMTKPDRRHSSHPHKVH
jgi:hypothetical protein